MTELHGHDRLIELVLSFEDLDHDERKEAEAHLSHCEDCTRRLQLAREREQRSLSTGELPELEDPAGFSLSPTDESAEKASLEALLNNAASGPLASPRRVAKSLPDAARPPEVGAAKQDPWWTLLRARFWAAGVPAIAMATVLVLFLAGRDDPDVDHLSAVPLGSNTTRDSTAPGTWKNGQAFALEMELNEDAHLFVILVDPLNDATLVYPSGSTSELTSAGRVQIPPASHSSTWILSGPAGTETFVVVGARAEPNLLAVRNQLEATERTEAAGDAGRALRLRELRSWLESEYEFVRIVEIEHLP